jgi:hypothetical protein
MKKRLFRRNRKRPSPTAGIPLLIEGMTALRTITRMMEQPRPTSGSNRNRW